jgi:thiamine kinase-like enzyme
VGLFKRLWSGNLLAMLTDDDNIRRLPCWNGRIEISPLHGGLSNTNYKVVDATGAHVVRFGQDYPFHHVQRKREVIVARAAHAAGFGPEVRYAALGVMVTQFLDAKTYSADDVQANSARIGALIKRFHTTMPQYITGTATLFWVFHVIRDYITTLQATASAKSKNFQNYISASQAFEAAQQPLPIIFGHHDLLPANFLDDGSRLWLIDFEYAGFGTAMFDLAGISSNAQMGQVEQNDLLTCYFSGGPDATIQKSFAAMQCASLLRETLWAEVSSHFLAATGIDYDAYAAENLQRYSASLELYQHQYGKINT